MRQELPLLDFPAELPAAVPPDAHLSDRQADLDGFLPEGDSVIENAAKAVAEAPASRPLAGVTQSRMPVPRRVVYGGVPRSRSLDTRIVGAALIGMALLTAFGVRGIVGMRPAQPVEPPAAEAPPVAAAAVAPMPAPTAPVRTEPPPAVPTAPPASVAAPGPVSSGPPAASIARREPTSARRQPPPARDEKAAARREAALSHRGAAGDAAKNRVVAPPRPAAASASSAPRPAAPEPSKLVLAPLVDAQMPAAIAQPPERAAAIPPAPSTPTVVAEPPAAVRTTGTVVPAAASATADERAAIQNVLSRYRSAYSELDARAVKQVWPSATEPALAKAFAGLESQSLAFYGCETAIAGSTARATCDGQVSYVGRVGSRQARTQNREWTFQLRKTNGDRWEIDRVQVR